MQSKRLHLIILSILSVLTLSLQTKNVGFTQGHYGWVTAHVLSEIIHATPQNHFLGYAVPVIADNGQPDYAYFDRYPIFFTGLMNLAISPFDGHLAQQIYWARLLMNFIFIGMLFAGYFLLTALFKNPFLSLLTTLIIFSSSTILFYKDMVHFDQPTLLAILCLLTFIVRFETEGQKRGLWIMALVAVSTGRGYAALFTLAVWCASRLIRFRKIKGEISIFILISAVLLSSTFLAYNIYQESVVRNVSIQQTSIIRSAKSRLGIDPMTEELEYKARFLKVFTLQFENLYFNIFPAAFGGPDQLMKRLRHAGHSGGGIVLLLFIVGLFAFFIPKKIIGEWRKLSPTHQQMAWVLLLSGPAWGLFMRKLTAFHQYTAMYLIPTSLIFMYLFFKSYEHKFDTSKKQSMALAAAILLFISGLVAIKISHDENYEVCNQQTQDFQNMLTVLPSSGALIHADGEYTKIIPGSPFAPAYYLSQHFLAPEVYAKYILTKTRPEGAANLTPQNQLLFLRLK